MDFKETLNSISDSLEKFIKSQKTHNESVMTEIASIKRGVYGDETNLVRGLMERQLSDEQRLTKLEMFKWKLIWMSLGFGVAINGMIWVVKTFIF